MYKENVYGHKKVSSQSVCSIRVFNYLHTTQGYVFLDTLDIIEYDALQLSSPSATLKVHVILLLFCCRDLQWITSETLNT